MILAIDPGPTESAFVTFDEKTHRVTYYGKWPNGTLLEGVRCAWKPESVLYADAMIVEMIASYGMPVGAEVFETCVMIGQLLASWNSESKPVVRITRGAVKLQICGTARAKDSNVRQALIDRFGGSSVIKKGGSLYKVSGDVWAALAVAVTYAERTKAMQVAA